MYGQARAAGFGTVDCLTGHILEYAHHEGLYEVAHRVEVDLRCCPGDLHNTASDSLIGDRCCGRTYDALSGEYRHLRRAPVFHHCHQQDDDAMREVGVVEKLTRLHRDIRVLQELLDLAGSETIQIYTHLDTSLLRQIVREPHPLNE